ncbi:TPA: type II toxin-antitoxin system RelE/ParE family toxin [Shewanella algae]|uniref:type II toxin-antitoxin system RelE/ParE family toxin n=1 Tax=Shewanella algae TaxID=38313 RepID=UPI001C55AB68|nr:type II toxin-antitoxin system RelE/ParE family toxin [Shewanella algae]HDS1207844.1 type II toxin-antitoxin system RelE/ParE family toxin [Shewanella algae]
MIDLNTVISDVAIWTLEDIESFYTPYIGADRAADLTESLLRDTVSAIEEDPERYRFSARLADKGVRLRERITPDGQFTAIYDFDGETIEVLLFMSTKQDIESLLHRYMIVK